MTHDTCATCRFFRVISDDGDSGYAENIREGACQAHPPVPLDNLEAAFPLMARNEWCGEHKPIGDVPEPSPGLRWLWENGKRPFFMAMEEDNGMDRDEWSWFDNLETDKTSELPLVVMVELQRLNEHEARGCGGPGDMCIDFPDELTAMLAAARAVESSQYLAMEQHRKTQ